MYFTESENYDCVKLENITTIITSIPHQTSHQFHEKLSIKKHTHTTKYCTRLGV